MKAENLIFIVSQPRSGSTLLQKIISGHPNIATTGEPWILLQYVSFLKPSLINSEFNFAYSSEAFGRYLRKIQGFSFKDNLKNHILSVYEQGIGDARYFLDKTPRYYEIVDEIYDLFPSAKYLILKRNPLDVLSSIINSWNKKKHIELSEYYRDILVSPKKLHHFLDEHKNDTNVRSISYEDLLNSPEDVVQNIFSWLGIEYSEVYIKEFRKVRLDDKFGDQIGSNKYSELAQESLNSWQNLVKENKFWRNFFIGYAHSLEHKFLKSYGYDIQIKNMATKEYRNFERFVFFNREYRKFKSFKSLVSFLRLKLSKTNFE